MNFYVIQVLVLEDDEPTTDRDGKDITVFNGAFVVDSIIENNHVTMTTDMLGRARRFDTFEMADQFRKLGGLSSVNTRIVRIYGIPHKLKVEFL
jgi:hypothetical protein